MSRNIEILGNTPTFPNILTNINIKKCDAQVGGMDMIMVALLALAKRTDKKI